jgi:hypothetical protein
MIAKTAVIGSKGGKRRMVSLLCILTAQVLLLGALSRCGDGEWVMAPGGAAAYAPAN